MKKPPLLSRVAESVYWMSRYIERAENVARFIDVNLQLMLDAPAGACEQWLPIVDVTGDSAAFLAHYESASRSSVVEWLTFDERNQNSIISCLSWARENARSVRDTISSEMWEQINHTYLMMRDESRNGRAAQSAWQLFRHLRMDSHLFQGITDSTMSHNEAWHFIQLGRMLERADKTTRILDVKYFLLLPKPQDVGSPVDDVQWTAVLKSVSGFEMYRKRHGRISPTNVVDFLLLDREFPRTVRHCVQAAAQALYAITGTPEDSFSSPAERNLAQIRAELDYTPVRDVLQVGLHEFLDALQLRLNAVDDSIYDLFFAMRPVEIAAMA